MSLINCPSCQNKISNKIIACPHCAFSFNESQDDLDRLKIVQFRDYRDKMYLYKMLTYFSIAIAVAGFVPMLWSYAKAIDYGFNVSLLNHWGVYLVLSGFFLYGVSRVFMLITKYKYKAVKS